MKIDQKYDIVIAYPAENVKLFDTMIPLGIACILAVLVENGFTVRFVDFNHYSDNFEKDLAKWKPEVVGIGGTTPSRFESFNISKISKAVLPEVPTVYGGIHATFAVEDTLRNIPTIDYIIKGEGEYSFLKFCKKIIRKEDFNIESISGLCYRQNGRLLINPATGINNLDLLPIPIRNIKEIDYTIKMDFNGLNADFLLTTRGCPVRCTFCSASTMFPGGIRFRSMTKVKQELDEILANKPIKALKIFDSTFTADRDHVISFCKMIKSYNLLWECEIKADTVDYQLLKIMRDAGCYYIDMGLETTNEKLLKSLGKNITILQAKQVLDWCKELNIKTKVFFIFGLLDETYHDCKVDLKFLKEHKSQIDLFATTIGLRIYPGTSTAKELKKRGIMPESFSWANYKPSIKNLILFEFSNTYILEQKQLSFYKLFLVIILMVKQNTVLSPGHVKKLIFQNSKAFIHFLFIKFTH